MTELDDETVASMIVKVPEDETVVTWRGEIFERWISTGDVVFFWGLKNRKIRWFFGGTSPQLGDES